MLPCARKEGLVVQDLAGETVVYDLQRHQVHTLNPAASAVWRHSDGETPVSDIARQLSIELERPVDEDVVWWALERLQKANLLQDSVVDRPNRAAFNRRELAHRLRLIGGLSALLPIVTSMVAPTPAHAGVSCKDLGETCASATECCSARCSGVCF